VHLYDLKPDVLGRTSERTVDVFGTLKVRSIVFSYKSVVWHICHGVLHQVYTKDGVAPPLPGPRSIDLK